MSEIILYTTKDGQTKINVQLEDETVWLTQKQLVELYQTSKSTVSEHIKNIFADEELMPEATVRKIRTVQLEGSRQVARELDNILNSTGRKVLDNAGSISQANAKEKVIQEYKKYKAKTLSAVESEYLKSLSLLEQKAKKGDRLSKGSNNKGGKV